MNSYFEWESMTYLSGGWFVNEFGFILLLFTSALIISRRLPKKSCFAVRIGVTLTALFLFGLLYWKFLSEIYGNPDWNGKSKQVMSCLLYIFYFLLLTAGVCLSWKATIWVGLFCSTVAFSLSHIAQRVYCILDHLYLYPLPWPIKALIYCSIAVVCLCGLHYLFIQGNEHDLVYINVDNKKLLAVGIFVILITVVLGTILATYAVQLRDSNTLVIGYALTSASMVLALLLEFNLLFAKHRETDMERLEKLLTEKAGQLEAEQQNLSEIRIRLHDMRHFLQDIDPKVRKVSLEEFGKAIEDYEVFMKTGNETLDTILTQKNLICQRNGIRLTAVINGEDLSAIPPHELYALFGNALENAIEAVSLLPEEKRIISISGQKQNEFILIRIINYFGGEHRMVGGLPQTTKADFENHGFGMKSMRLIAERHGGRMRFNTRDDLFVLELFLPAPAVPAGFKDPEMIGSEDKQ